LYDDKAEIPKSIDNPHDDKNPVVFFDIKIGDAAPERIEIELF
jgi:hypothetical protein